MNDETWGRFWPRREALTDHIRPFVLEAAALQPAERVLDIGCGGGSTSIAAARLVGAGGAVVGCDISRPLLALAGHRAQKAASTNVTWLLADAQTDRMGERDYDVAISQFGVMFFEDAPAAFANVGRHLRPGGWLVFACWQTMGSNGCFPGAVLATYLPPPPPVPEGKSPTGPVALGDAGLVREVLAAAGFVGVDVQPRSIVVEVPAEALIDMEQLRFMGVAPDDIAEAWAAVERHLSQFGDPRGLCCLPLDFHLITARWPG